MRSQRQRAKRFLFPAVRTVAILGAMLLAGVAQPAWAQLAVLLPNGQQQFVDANGAPLAAGSVGFYIPSTLTPKTTWVDPGQATPNTNPVNLDSAGRAIIYGSGQYREIVKDVSGNTIWDQLTYGSGPFPVWGGTSTGTGNAPVVSAGNWVLQNGEQIAWRVGSSNSGATALTIGSNSYTLYKDANGGPTALVGGELVAGNLVLAIYDSTLGGLHLSSSPPGASAIGKLGSLAAASTTDLGTITSQNVSVTGTGVTINSFGSSANTASPLYLVTFVGATNTLTQSASLTLPGNATTQLNAGDSLWALYAGSGVWDVLQIMRSGGPSLPVFEQGRLQFTSTSVVTLVGVNGNQVSFPSGATCTIPSAGIPATITNAYVNGTAGQTLSASTLYYAYLWNQGTATAPNCVEDFSATSHATDANSGIEIKSGDATRVLVGAVYPNAGPVFADSASNRLVASWANRRPRQLSNVFSTPRSTSSASYVEINSEIRSNFISWGDGIYAAYAGSAYGATVNTFGGPSIDSATSSFPATVQNVTSNPGNTMSTAGYIATTEGFHYLTYMGASAGTSTWNTANSNGFLTGSLVN